MDYSPYICLQQVFGIKSTRGTSVLFSPPCVCANYQSYHKHYRKHRNNFCCLHTLTGYFYFFLRLQLSLIFTHARCLKNKKIDLAFRNLFLFCCQASSVFERFVYAQFTHATRAQTIAIRMSLNANTACLLSCFSFVSKHSASTPVTSDRIQENFTPF